MNRGHSSLWNPASAEGHYRWRKTKDVNAVRRGRNKEGGNPAPVISSHAEMMRCLEHSLFQELKHKQIKSKISLQLLACARIRCMCIYAVHAFTFNLVVCVCACTLCSVDDGHLTPSTTAPCFLVPFARCTWRQQA